MNHQATLSIKHLNVIAALKPDNPSIGIMIVKQNTRPARVGIPGAVAAGSRPARSPRVSG